MQDFVLGPELQTDLHQCIPEKFSDGKIYKWVSVNGYTYKTNSCLLTDIRDMVQVFSIVLNVLVKDNFVGFVCSKTNVVFYNRHFHSHELQVEPNTFFVTYNELLDPVPCAFYEKGNCKLVTLNHCL